MKIVKFNGFVVRIFLKSSRASEKSPSSTGDIVNGKAEVVEYAANIVTLSEKVSDSCENRDYILDW